MRSNAPRGSLSFAWRSEVSVSTAQSRSEHFPKYELLENAREIAK